MVFNATFNNISVISWVSFIGRGNCQKLNFLGEGIRVMVLNATFNNISVILWRSVLLVEETAVSEEDRWPEASYWQTLSHKVHLVIRMIIFRCYTNFEQKHSIWGHVRVNIFNRPINDTPTFLNSKFYYIPFGIRSRIIFSTDQ